MGIFLESSTVKILLFALLATRILANCVFGAVNLSMVCAGQSRTVVPAAVRRADNESQKTFAPLQIIHQAMLDKLLVSTHQ